MRLSQPLNLPRWVESVIPATLVLLLLLIPLVAQVYEGTRPYSTNHLISIDGVRGGTGAEDTLLFVIMVSSRGDMAKFRLPVSQCELNFRLYPGTCRLVKDKGIVFMYFRPAVGSILLPLPSPNRFPLPANIAELEEPLIDV